MKKFFYIFLLVLIACPGSSTKAVSDNIELDAVEETVCDCNCYNCGSCDIYTAETEDEFVFTVDDGFVYKEDDNNSCYNCAEFFVEPITEVVEIEEENNPEALQEIGPEILPETEVVKEVEVEIEKDVNVCIPDCKNKECGDDGCGGKCGECKFSYLCETGECIYIAYCGNNNCEEVTGENCESCPKDCACDVGSKCYEKKCCEPITCDDSIYECDKWSDGCEGEFDCGNCLGGYTCEDGICKVIKITGCEEVWSICLYYDEKSKQIVLTNFGSYLYQKAIFYTGIENAPYPNIEVSGIMNEWEEYFPVPENVVYKLFNLVGMGGAWMLVDPKNNDPILGKGLEYWCNEKKECAILISERK